MSTPNFTDVVTRLGMFVCDLEACETVDEVYDRAVIAAERVIEFDAAIVCTVENGAFVPRAVNVDRLVPGEPLAVGEGIAGKTLREDRPYVVDDLGSEPDAAPTSDRFRSVLSVPFEDVGIVQFHARERAAFSTVDRRLGELLASIVSNARGRVAYETALGRERDRFAALFENVPDAALQYRVEQGTQFVDAVNSSFIRIFGYDADEAIGEPVEDLLVPRDERNEPELITESETNGRTDVEVVRETASGPRPFLVRNVPVGTSDDTVRGYLIYTDLTELKARERELERKNERLDEFASIVSHDLQNPLNVAEGYLELARERHSCSELDEVERAHDRMRRLIDDVLALARQGESVDEFETVHLASIARRSWEHVSTEDATLETDADALIDADRHRLIRLFENLFCNAIEHAGETVTVRVGSRDDGFAVEDDGLGIPTDDRGDVFESGYSAKPANTGLGLAIVREIADAHGWTVNATEAAAGGARFEISGCRVRPFERGSTDDDGSEAAR